MKLGMRGRALFPRYLWFIAGVLINAFGVALITKAGLGTSPISSVPYVLSLRLRRRWAHSPFL